MQAPGRYEIYAVLAALALLFRWEPGMWFHHPGANIAFTGWLPAFAALGVLLRPGDLRLLLAMYAGVAVDAFHVAPAVPNHYVLTLCVGLTWFALAASARLRDPGLALETAGERVLADGAPAMRIGVAVFYAFTGLWKLNAGFLDPATSCGVASWMRLVGQFPFLPAAEPVPQAVIGFTLALELVGPLLLLWRPTRAPMAAAFVFFHLVLATDFVQNYQNFSWAMMPLLTLFLPDDTWERVARAVPSLPSVVGFAARLGLAGHVGLIVIASLTTFRVHLISRFLFSLGLLGGWLVLAVAAAAVARGGGYAWRAPAAAWTLLALVVANGLTPVVGLKNRNAWQMYSNVRIEADASNHLLLPPSLDLFGLQADPVRILGTDDLELRHQTVDVGLGMTWWDLRVWLAQNPFVSVEWERAGQVGKARPGGPRPDPPPWLLRKVVWFRPVGPGVSAQCQW